MADFNKPVQVTVDGELRFNKQVAPSLPTLLDSFARRRDWGLVYPAKITLDLGDDENGASPSFNGKPKASASQTRRGPKTQSPSACR
jgi:hypothetical protein